MRSNSNINLGHCQGILVGDVYSPNDNVSIVTLKVKDNHIDAATKKRTVYFIEFTAFDENALLLRLNALPGQILYLEYILTNSKKTDEKGVSKFFRNRIITNVVLGDVISPDKPITVPYQNIGYLQGEYVGIRRLPNAVDIYILTIRVHMVSDKGRAFTCYHQFVVFGQMWEIISQRYQKSSRIFIEYKIETGRKVKADGKSDFFIDYVVVNFC